MGDLYGQLQAYGQSDYYPYHMPGHKRILSGDVLNSVKKLDITEIDDFDNLHDAKGIIDQIQKKAARIFGAEESFYLVNGSTCGILAAISTVMNKGDQILMTRGCHRAAYHGAYLREIGVKYIWPGINSEFGVCKAVTVEEVSQALLDNNQIKAVMIVSPTYEGYIADVSAIAKVVHKKGIPLIVDEAHGAHLGFHPAWKKNSISLGADIVIQSLHKTMPSPTQTAILHVSGKLVDRSRLKRFLSIYQTSSPSYLFMASMEEAIDLVSENREQLFNNFLKHWCLMLENLKKCECIHVLNEEGMDIGKLVISDFSGNYSGYELYHTLRNRFHLQMEMASGNYVLAMFTVADGEEAYERLTQALITIDAECKNKPKKKRVTYGDIWKVRPEEGYLLSKAWDMTTTQVTLEAAVGRYAGEFINLYPPGIPYMVPGEKFTNEECLCLKDFLNHGFSLQGVTEVDNLYYVKVIK